MEHCDMRGCRQEATSYCQHCLGYFCSSHLRVIIGDMETPSMTVCEECYRDYQERNHWQQAHSAAIQGH